MSPWVSQLHLLFSYDLDKTSRIKEQEVSRGVWNVSSQNTQHTAPAEAMQRAVNNSFSYFSAWEGNKAFQLLQKECFRNCCVGSVGRDKREVPRNLQGIKHTEEIGSFAKFVAVPWYHGIACKSWGALRPASETLPKTLLFLLLLKVKLFIINRAISNWNLLVWQINTSQT